MNHLDVLLQEILDKCDEVEQLRSAPYFRRWMLIELRLLFIQQRLAKACQIDPSIKRQIDLMNTEPKNQDERYFRELVESYKAMRIEIHDEKLPLID